MRHGGIHSCAVLTGYNTLEQLRAAQPDVIVEHLGELREILQQNDLHLKPPVKEFEAAHPPVITVGALIFNGAGEVLMIRTHKWSNLWGIPGGKVKWGEPSEEALRREIKEETGLDVLVGPIIETFDRVHRDDAGRIRYHFVIVDFVCWSDEGEAKPGSDAEATAWATGAELDTYGVNAHAAAVIRHGLKAPRP